MKVSIRHMDITVVITSCTGLLLIVIYMTAIDARKINIIRVNATNEKSPYYYCQYCECSEDDTFIDCSGLGFFKPARDLYENATVVLFNGNRIRTIKQYYFRGLTKLRYLHLGNNIITTIEAESFKDLASLEALYLDGNQLTMYETHLKPGIFKGLGNLKVLTLHKNIYFTKSSLDVESMMGVFPDLVSLEMLYIDGLTDVKFKDPFKPLTKLTTLVIASALDDTNSFRQCNIGNLSADAFEGVPMLRNLTIQNCGLNNINISAFWGLNSLYYLDLSWNKELKFSEFGRAMEGLQDSNLTVLHVNAINDPNRAGTELEEYDLRYLGRMPLQEVYMDNNAIEYIPLGVFNKFPTTLRHLSMRRNRMVFGLYLEEAIFSNPGLQVFDASDQEIGARSDDVGQFRDVDRENGFIMKRDTRALDRLPDTADVMGKGENQPATRTKRQFDEVIELSLQQLSCSGSLSYPRLLNFTDTVNNISYMDISRNYIPVLRTDVFNGLPRLEGLNLSGNSIEYVHTEAFRGLENLKLLDLYDNLLGNALSLDTNGYIFRHLRSIEFLLLGQNRIYTIQKNVFIHLKYLRILDISRNHLRTIDVDFTRNKHLQALDLTGNRIDNVPARTRRDLDEASKGRILKVNLLSNELGCRCETVQVLEWLMMSSIKFDSMEEYVCAFNNGSTGSLKALSTVVTDLKKDCKSYLPHIVTGATGGSFIISLLVSYLVYRNRWKLRYMYYMAKAKLDVKDKENFQDLRFDFDIFLSYADENRQFVIQKFADNVETHGGKRLNIRDRDFEIGESVAVNISKAIRTSKKTYLLLSRHALKNKWCNFEMNMAVMEGIHTRRKVLVVIFLEEIPANAMSLDLIHILRNAPKTDFPKDERLQPAFWQRCIAFCNDD